MRADPRAMVRLGVLALVIGALNALVYLGFEWVVKHGTDWIWNDLAGSDEARWRVLPLALALSLAFSALVRALRAPRWTDPHVDPLHDAGDDGPPPTLTSLGVILLIGGASLLAGASLGPEATLVAAAMALGGWLSAGVQSRLFALTSVGALLVAFLGSLVAAAIPLLVLYNKAKRLPLPAVAAILLAAGAAYGTLELVRGNAHGFAEIPSFDVRVRDYPAALVLGVAAVGIGILLRWFTTLLGDLTQQLDTRLPWWLSASVFGAVLGLLYLLGGESSQFSGAEGSAMLLTGEVRYGAAALVGLVLVKLLATAWSLTAGYRGGLIFPAVYAAVALSLAVAEELPDIAGPGILIGAIAGLLVEMTAPALGVVMLLALLPVELLPLGFAGAVGAVAGRAALDRRARTPDDLS